MTHKKPIWPWHLLMIAYIAAVAYLCFGKFSSLPNVQSSYFGIATDKLVHFGMFFPFPILASLSIRQKGKTPWRALWRTVGIFLLGCCLAAGTELIQGLTTYRSSDPADFTADSLALAVSSAIALAAISIKFNNKRK